MINRGKRKYMHTGKISNQYEFQMKMLVFNKSVSLKNGDEQNQTAPDKLLINVLLGMFMKIKIFTANTAMAMLFVSFSFVAQFYNVQSDKGRVGAPIP